MKKVEEVYQELKKRYTEEEIAESFIFSEPLPDLEQKEVIEEFLRIRMERLHSMTEAEILSAKGAEKNNFPILS